MIIKYKDLNINEKKFVLAYLTKVEDYELEISKGRIALEATYYPETLMSLTAAEKVVESYREQLLREASLIMDEHQEFYEQFEPETGVVTGSSGGRNVFGDEVANYAYLTMYLKQRVAV